MMPTPQSLKHIIRSNLIKNNPVLEQDYHVAEQIFGKDIPSLKGKSKRSKPTPVVDDTVAIPRKLLDLHQFVHSFIDLMFVNGKPFLVSISKNIHYRTAESIPDACAATFYKALPTY